MAEPFSLATIALPPYGYSEKGQPKGLTYELGNAIATEAGLTPTNSILPFARAMEEIALGKVDAIIMFPNPTIDSCAENLGLVLPMETIILGRAGTPLRSLRDVRGKTLATIRGAKYDDRISKKNGIILYPTDSYSQSLKMLLAKRVDAVVGPKMGLYFTAKRDAIPKRALGAPLVLSVAKGCFFLSNKVSDGQIRQRLIEAIERLKKNGTINALSAKYAL